MACKYINRRIVEVKHKTVFGLLALVGVLAIQGKRKKAAQ